MCPQEESHTSCRGQGWLAIYLSGEHRFRKDRPGRAELGRGCFTPAGCVLLWLTRLTTSCWRKGWQHPATAVERHFASLSLILIDAGTPPKETGTGAVNVMVRLIWRNLTPNGSINLYHLAPPKGLCRLCVHHAMLASVLEATDCSSTPCCWD